MSIIAPSSDGASSRDYAWLKATVAGWLHRTDLDASIPDFVMLAERRIRRDLQARLQSTTVELATVANEPLVTLPDDFDAVRTLVIPGHRPMVYLTPEQLAAECTLADYPRHYTIVGNSLQLSPTPSTVYTMRLTYRATVPALADTADGVNWLIQQDADLYLAATMVEATFYTKDTAANDRWEGKYRVALDSLNASDWNCTGPLTVRVHGMTP